MTDQPFAGVVPPARPGLILRLAGSRRFQAFAARVPGLRRIARAEGAALFDLVAGFVQSQALLALVELRVLHRLQEGALPVAALAAFAQVPPERMQILLQAGAAMGLLNRRRDGRFALAPRGAALLAVPGLVAMIRHHPVLYRDLADPVAFFRGQTDPELARFWPYVFGAGATDPAVTAEYSALMADSQSLVAEDVLRLVDLSDARHLLDVGGGSGAFLAAVAAAYPALALGLFDLPDVVKTAPQRLAAAGISGRVALHSGSFRTDALPQGADVISLIRVLYDHADATVAGLLARVHAALPQGGRVLVAEPMSGGARPDRATDTYFALYTLAMQTGRTRSGAEIAGLLAAAGFTGIRVLPGYRPFVTSAVVATRA
ncbi:SAM-dependent methyltransferase [Fertoebacter nigrum]|uniref:SAM-dependent methyltransferase n=1 Tax=Fertoeibacter niger TaxID=2656921 RepID=A0A8X8GSH6_9RHOB|nr:methyltransferase [Fertoeibacter niger]NUB43503.1 SAM-dependent methyltransferase [Fertoeibacter niger]